MCRLCVSVDDLSRPAWSNGKISLVMLATRLALSLSPSVTPISAPGFGGGTWPHKVTHDDDRKLFVMRGHGNGAHLGAHPAAACLHAPRRAGGTAARAVAAAGPRMSYVAGAHAGAPPASTCTHMPHVARHDHVRSWSRCSSPSVTYALAHVTLTLKLRGHAPPCEGPRSEELACGRQLKEGVLGARVGVRDKVGPRGCVTERSTRLLGNALEQPSKIALLACVHHGQIDRVGSCRIVCWYARRRCAGTRVRGSCRGLGSQPSRLDCESGLSGGSEDARCSLRRR